jgi:hypothetical protein|tara:strand:+ start:55 stop:237 length:183 start_codon:yes stop_codon:yes gene_type:complete
MKFQLGLNTEDIRPKLKRVMLYLDVKEDRMCGEIAKRKNISKSALFRHWQKQYVNAYKED